MRKLWQLVASFFKYTWRTLNFIRHCVLNLIFIFLVLACAGIWFALSGEGTSSRPKEGALKIDLVGSITDQGQTQIPLSKFGLDLLSKREPTEQENSLFNIVDAIRQAKDDKKINGIVLDLRDLTYADLTSLEYIGKALGEFHQAKKPIYAISDNYNQAQYFLASYADKIYLSTLGAVELYGLSSKNIYYKSLLDKLKVNSHVFRVGTYKSAVEPMLRDDMSPEAREATQQVLTQIWQSYLEKVSRNRKVTPEQLFPGPEALLDRLEKADGDMALYAKENKWVDEVIASNDFNTVLAGYFGWNKDKTTYNATSIYDYKVNDKNNPKGNIAVILASGTIGETEGPGNINSTVTAKEIRDARLNPDIKAIILRVNSPGGSVNASEIIREELAAVRAAGKPIVISGGSVFASGGYWISTPADYIIASPTSLTGSIGIYRVEYSFENSLESLGVHTDAVSTSALADVGPTRALPPEAQRMMQISIENGYKRFLQLVATSRHKTPEEVDKIAQGRVWTGADAKKLGLVDELGDFDTAVAKAAELAKLPEYQLNWTRKTSSFFDLLLNQLSFSVNAEVANTLKVYLPPGAVDTLFTMKKQAALFGSLNDPHQLHAICLSCGEML